MIQKILLIIIAVLVFVGVISHFSLTGNTILLEDSKLPEITNCTIAFRDGGGPYYIHDVPFREKIVPEKTNGEKITIRGRVIWPDCTTPIPRAIINFWQANEEGNYDNEWYRGYVITNEKGEYTLKTIIPAGYGEGTAGRPPHIHYKVFVNDKEYITSQLFFPDVAGKINDAYIIKFQNNQPYFDIVLPLEPQPAI